MNYIITIKYRYDDPVEVTMYVHNNNSLKLFVYSLFCDVNVTSVILVDSMGNRQEKISKTFQDQMK